MLLLPWAAPALAVMAGAAAADLHGQDGTALWMTLITGSEREDLRDRQIANLYEFVTPTTMRDPLVGVTLKS
ncbi:hypothetical protein [Nonomuraea maritima]|uniref:hypothetical protein n=1 Tax=Nonomuraea maritima TaxID=683260 RepID=UPI0037141B6E